MDFCLLQTLKNFHIAWPETVIHGPIKQHKNIITSFSLRNTHLCTKSSHIHTLAQETE